MSSALLRWISSKGWPSDGSMTAMLRPETDATQALAIWFSCMGRYFARNPIAVLCWQKSCPLAHFLAASTAIFFAVFQAQAPGSRAPVPGAGAHRFAVALRVPRDTCAGRGPRQAAGPPPPPPPPRAPPRPAARGPPRAKPLAPPPVARSGARGRRGGLGGGVAHHPPWNLTTSGTISSATMLMILISGLIAGPAVSL